MRPAFVRVREMVRKEFQQTLRDPKLRAIIFISPLIQLVVFGYAVVTEVKTADIFAVDHSKTMTSHRFLEAFSTSGAFRIIGRSDDPAELVEALDRGNAVLGIQVPNEFTDSLFAGGAAEVQMLVDGSNSSTATQALAYAGRIVERFSQDFGRVETDPPAEIVEVRMRSWYNPDLESQIYNVPGVIAVVLLLMCLLLTALSVVREREVGTLDQLMVSPLTPTELMAGKSVPVLILAYIDLLLVTIVSLLWFQVPLRGSIPALALAALLFILTGLAVGLLISTMASTQQEAFMVMFLFFLPAILLSGFMSPVSSMPVFFQWVAQANPVTQFLEIVRGIFLKGHGILDRWPQYLALAAMAVGTLVLAMLRFHRSLG